MKQTLLWESSKLKLQTYDCELHDSEDLRNALLEIFTKNEIGVINHLSITNSYGVTWFAGNHSKHDITHQDVLEKKGTYQELLSRISKHKDSKGNPPKISQPAFPGQQQEASK